MPGETRFVDVVWRGLRLAQKAKLSPSAETAAFVEIEAPLPVGTKVRLEGAGDDGGFAVEARVVSVVEQETGARSAPGMRVDWSVEKPAEVSSIAVASSDLLPMEEASAEESTEVAEEPATPTDGKRKRRRQKTIIGRP